MVKIPKKQGKVAQIKKTTSKKNVSRKNITQKKTAAKTIPVKKDTKNKKIKSHFGKTELEYFKEKLLNLREDIMRQIRDISEDTLMKSQKDISGDMSGYGIHIADVATDNYEREFNLGLVSEERKILFEIDEALKRIDEGTYGVCLISGKPIARNRLEAIPYAKYSKEVKEQLEKENKI